MCQAWEVNDLKGAITERSSGDARAQMCIMDTFNDLEIGRSVLKKYPQMRRLAEHMEKSCPLQWCSCCMNNCNKELNDKYCSVNMQKMVHKIDKMMQKD